MKITPTQPTDFLDQINSARIAKQMTATNVAASLGANFKTVSEWLNKTRQPKLDDLNALASVVGLRGYPKRIATKCRAADPHSFFNFQFPIFNEWAV